MAKGPIESSVGAEADRLRRELAAEKAKVARLRAALAAARGSDSDDG